MLAIIPGNGIIVLAIWQVLEQGGQEALTQA